MVKKAGRRASRQTILSIDVGGSHVKVLTSDGGTERRVVSGPKMTGTDMIAAAKTLAEGLAFDVISIGYPGPVKRSA